MFYALAGRLGVREQRQEWIFQFQEWEGNEKTFLKFGNGKGMQNFGMGRK